MKKPSWDILFLVIYVVVVLVLINGFIVQRQIDQVREEYKHVERRVELTPVEFIATGVMGGSRGLVISYLWAKIIRLEAEHNYYEIESLANLVTKLQPNFPTVWVFNSWNLAYNIAVDWRAREDRWKWIKAGVDVAKEGLAKNPNSVELLFELGWLYYHKISSETGDPDYYWMMEQVYNDQREQLIKEGKNPLYAKEALMLAAEYFDRAQNAGTHPRTSHRTLEMQELFALQQLSKYLLLEKPKPKGDSKEDEELRALDIQRGFEALEKSVALAEEMIKLYPDYEGFRNRMMAFAGETIPAMMAAFPPEEYPERAVELEEALARIIVVVQQYNADFFYIDIE